MKAKEKYFKYKAKYLELKNKLNGSGYYNETRANEISSGIEKEKIENKEKIDQIQKLKLEKYEKTIKEYNLEEKTIFDTLNKFILTKSNCGSLFSKTKCVNELLLFNKYVQAEITRAENYYQTLKKIALSEKNNANDIQELELQLLREKDRDGLLAYREIKKCIVDRTDLSEKLKKLYEIYLKKLEPKNNVLDNIIETYTSSKPLESNYYVEKISEIINVIKKL